MDYNFSLSKVKKTKARRFNAELCRYWRYKEWMTIEKNLFGYIVPSAAERQEQKYMMILFL